MKCPFCSFEDSKVVDSRPTDEGTSIRRRRECLHCGKRFTTYEDGGAHTAYADQRDGTRQAMRPPEAAQQFGEGVRKRPVSL